MLLEKFAHSLNVPYKKTIESNENDNWIFDPTFSETDVVYTMHIHLNFDEGYAESVPVKTAELGSWQKNHFETSRLAQSVE